MQHEVNLLPGVPLVESPLFDTVIDAVGFTEAEREIAQSLNRLGYAVFDFPDAQIDERIARIKSNLSPRYDIDLESTTSVKTSGDHRIQDAWRFDADVQSIAKNPQVLTLLEKLYGRKAFPFQTLNFPVGTQQHMHSDSVHFSSQPERFMCGVWVAFEDVKLDAGPLQYFPGSHRWPIITNLMIGRRGIGSDRSSAQAPFETIWRALVAASNVQSEVFLARKGQALVWAANLLHGGMEQRNSTSTRWSQVTHYFFENCLYYTPAFSDEAIAEYDLRHMTDISTGLTVRNQYQGQPFDGKDHHENRRKPRWYEQFARRHPTAVDADLPKDFDAEVYYRLNPDVARANADAAEHYLRHGQHEGRRFR